MPTTLKDLAAQAGVHPSTVSRIVNGDPHLRVSDETRRRVNALLRKTDYRPNAIARGLRLRQSRVLGVLIPDVLNPLFAGIFAGVEATALEYGYTVVLCTNDGQRERERDLLLTLQARRLDGLVVATAFLNDPAVAWARRQRIPHVLVNRFSDGRDPFVGCDDEAGARLVTQHLLDLGHRRIAHLAGSERISTGVQRRRGYLRALDEAGVAADPALVVEAGLVEAAGAEAALHLLDLPAPPTAIVAVNDMAALGAYDALESRGLHVPGDVAVTGYNDMPLAGRLRPGLTTVRVPAPEMGRRAAQLLLDQLEAGRPRLQRVILPVELVVRGSTVAGLP